MSLDSSDEIYVSPAGEREGLRVAIMLWTGQTVLCRSIAEGIRVLSELALEFDEFEDRARSRDHLGKAG
jgi:hypothetical protein